jgi:hypothetical protein
MRRLIYVIQGLIARALRRVADGLTARLMLIQASHGFEGKPLSYRGWAVTLVSSRGCFILVAGRRSRARLEDVAALLGALVRVSGSKDSALPPLQVVSRTGRFVAWGWRPDGLDLSAGEQTLILSTVLRPRERVDTHWKDWN